MTVPGLAIGLQLLAVVWWIGGLAFVTLVLLPALRSDHVDDPHALLDIVERRFAPQARLSVLMVGASGGYLLWTLGAWRCLAAIQFWWLDAMIGYWLLFFMTLFVLEPLGLLQRRVLAARDPARAWRRFHAPHAVLLGLGAVVVAAAAAGSHGF